MLSIINPSLIVKNHYKTLFDDMKTYLAILLFLIIPSLISILLVLSNKLVNQNLIATLLNVFSIFSGLLFNVVVLIYSFQDKLKQDITSLGKKKQKLYNHLLANSLYALFVGTILIVILFFALLIAVETVVNTEIIIWSFIIYAITLHFLLTLLMIFRRFQILISV